MKGTTWRDGQASRRNLMFRGRRPRPALSHCSSAGTSQARRAEVATMVNAGRGHSRATRPALQFEQPAWNEFEWTPLPVCSVTYGGRK